MSAAVEETPPSRRSRPSWSRTQPRQLELRERILFAALSFLLMGSVLAIGTVHTTSLVIIAAASLATLVFALSLRANVSERLMKRAALGFALIIGYTLLQSVPLPMSLLERIAPHAADVWSRSLLPLGREAPSWASISLDPNATRVEALKLFVYACVFLVALIASSRGGAIRVGLLVFVSALVLALVTLVHLLLDMEKVFGLYAPAAAIPKWHIGPLLNPNNLAGYLNLGAFCAVGVLLSSSSVIPKWMVGFGLATIIAVDVASASRGGVGALILGTISLGLFHLVNRKRAQRKGVRRNVKWHVIVAVGGGAVLAFLGGSRTTWTELYEANLRKLDMLSWVKPLVADHPAWGIGRGAFESVFPAYRSTPGRIIFSHPENFIAQWICEWGIVVGCVMVALLVVVLSPQRLHVAKSGFAASAWIGIIAFLLQNMTDLGLEVPALCIALSVVFGALWGDGRFLPSSGATTRAQQTLSLPKLVLVPAALLILGLLFLARNPAVAEDRVAIFKQYQSDGIATPDVRSALRTRIEQAIGRHPAEPYFPLIGAMVAFWGRDQNPIPWVQRTLERDPQNGAIHIVLANILMGKGARGQAFFEARLAVEKDEDLTPQVADFVVARATSVEEARLAAPEGSAGAKVLDAVSSRMTNPDRRDLAIAINTEAIALDPTLPGPRIRALQRLLDALSPESPSDECKVREPCVERIVQGIEVLEKAEPTSSAGARYRAQLLVVEGQNEAADALLQVACSRVRDRLECLRARVLVASGIKAMSPLSDATRQLLNTACTTPARCAEYAGWVASIQEQRGDVATALALYRRAANDDPSEVRLLALADAASRASMHVQAIEALEKVAQRRGGRDTSLSTRIANERARVMGSH